MQMQTSDRTKIRISRFQKRYGYPNKFLRNSLKALFYISSLLMRPQERGNSLMIDGLES